MTQPIVVDPLALSSRGALEAGSAAPLPASPGAVQKFNQLMFSAGGAAAPTIASPMLGGTGNTLTAFVQRVSQRWEMGQGALKGIAEGGKVGASELMLVQIQLMNCALDVELSSKSASLLENGVQTVMQRGGA